MTAHGATREIKVKANGGEITTRAADSQKGKKLVECGVEVQC